MSRLGGKGLLRRKERTRAGREQPVSRIRRAYAAEVQGNREDFAMHYGLAWLLLCMALAVHVLDEACTDFFPVLLQSNLVLCHRSGSFRLKYVLPDRTKSGKRSGHAFLNLRLRPGHARLMMPDVRSPT